MKPPTASSMHARRRPDAALELVADHPGAATDRAFVDRAAGRGRERRVQVLRTNVEAVDVVEQPVERLADHRQRPRGVVDRRSMPRTSASRTTPTLCVLVIAIGVVSIPNSRTHSRPGQLAVAVQPVSSPRTPARARAVAARADDGDAGPHRSFADDERPVAADQRRVADGHARDVGDGVERARRAQPDPDPQVSCSHRPTVTNLRPR